MTWNKLVHCVKLLTMLTVPFESIIMATFVFSSTEIDDMLRKSTNLLLTRTLSSCLLNLIRKPHMGLAEVG
jgi:hypothetical protein